MYCPCQSRSSLTVFAFCGGSPNLAELDKCRPMIVKQSRIQKRLGWLINESKNSAHSAVSFDGDCTARSTQFRPGRVRSTRALQLLRRCQLPLRLRLPSGLLPKYRIDKSWMETYKPTYVIPTGDAPSSLWERSDELHDLKISLDEQVKHLFNLYDSDFDATRLAHSSSRTCSADEEVFRQLAFRVTNKEVARIAAALLEIDMDVATTEAEKHINRILAELQSVEDKIYGTDAQMLDMRNEIRGYVNTLGILGRIKDKFLDQADTV
ncbi:BQ5605_C001g00095 [Microbotryum silenes-dioicae]|uniref:BQ5605_C001g00095 protein n=1 Tax=Microbotryum silenes-dioicae TaxID=796604 RepID=A0A2X0P4X1_9BASI|nr:BQ5605_C001g00095 [Microbotryum silenes-dioicae]